MSQSLQSEENTLLNYSSLAQNIQEQVQQVQLAEQQTHQNLLGVPAETQATTNALSSDYDYLNNSNGYFNTVAATSTKLSTDTLAASNTSSTAVTNGFDINNNLKFAELENSYHTKMFTNFVGKSVPYIQAPGNTLSNVSCNYATANGSASCYNRNRYMPYNHNRVCAAAAAAANAHGFYAFNAQHTLPQNPAHYSLANNANNFSTVPTTAYQQYAPIYRNNVALSNSVVSAAPDAGIITAVNANKTAPVIIDQNNNEMPKSIAAASNSISEVVNTTRSLLTSTPYSSNQTFSTVTDPSQTVTLQITNLDYSMDESSLRNFLLNQLKPITPVVSLIFEGSSYAKVTVPDLFFAKQVVSYLHRKKIGHKRMLVSYTRDSSLTEINTLRCQVAGLLKDVPYYTLPMYKFRELFQSRFKTSISVLDLYKMQDICTINADSNEEKFISLQPELINSLETLPLMEGLQHSVPYCTIHFKREQHKGWAEQEIEPLPNVSMTIAEIEQIITPLLKNHPGDIPVASLVHCIDGELNIQINTNDSGVNLEHLVCCVQGVQILMNNFGIKTIVWHDGDKDNTSMTQSINSNVSAAERSMYAKNSVTDPLYQISREVIELVKMSPKSTMKFNRFIPAYHNHFGKQCRVADYGYTKLIELFEALSSVVQIMGDGENRQITLTHRTQIRRFTSDLLRVLRAHGNKSVLLSQLPCIFAQTQNRSFEVTDYGVCDIVDILDGLVNSNIVVVSTVQNGKDLLISIPKRKQTNNEIEKTLTFAGEMVELFRNAPQYTILFQKFVRSYHYHFAYQCRLSDYGFLKLADLMEAIKGVVDMETTIDEDKKIFLSPKVARRVFAEQCEELIRGATGTSKTAMKLDDVLKMHKKKFGYQIQPQTLGVSNITEAVEQLPYVEMFEKDEDNWIICHNDDAIFRNQCYRACKYLVAYEAGVPLGVIHASNNNNKQQTEDMSKSPEVTENKEPKPLTDFIADFNKVFKDNITENIVKAMKHAVETYTEKNTNYVRISNFMKFLMNVVRLLEQRPTITIHAIKTSLECNTSTTFEFGYPNIFTILTAYPDIFSVNMGITQERSEVSLIANCELRLNGKNRQHLYGSLKLPFLKQKNSRVSRLPLSESNNRHTNNGPPAKIRALSNNDIGNHNKPLNTNNSFNHHNGSIKNLQHSFTQLLSHPTSSNSKMANKSSSSAIVAKPFASVQNYSNGYNSSSSIYSTASHHSSYLNNSSSGLNSSSNKENSFANNSLNLLSSSLNSSNPSFSEQFNSSMCNNNPSMTLPMPTQMMPQAPTVYHPIQGSKLWDRRQAAPYIMQQQQPVNNLAPLIMQHSPTPSLPMPQQITLKQSAPPGLTPSLPTTSVINDSIGSGLFELVNNMRMCPIYEPPKPDTPPSDNMPFWIDPIWSNLGNQNLQTNDALLNIKLPEIKALNVLPMLLSPYTLSKYENMKQQSFNFDSHDRKIA